MSLDNDSAYHKAISFTVIHNSAKDPITIPPKQYDYSSTKLNHTKWELTEHKFPEITTEDGSYYYTHNESKILAKIQNFTEVLTTIQNKYTKLRKAPKSSYDQGHPWTKDRRYRVLVNTRKECKRVSVKHPSPENNALLRKAHIACFDYYNKLKTKYYKRIATNTSGNSMEFYTLVKSKTNARVFPPMLTHNGSKDFGSDRFEIIAKQLHSSFTSSTIEFSKEHYARYLQLERIYDENIKKDHANIRSEYTETFSYADVENIVSNLNEKKDPGPMGLTATFIKFNACKLIPIIHQYFSRILEHGIIPNQWETSYIVPIPKKGSKTEVSNYRGIALQSILPKYLTNY